MKNPPHSISLNARGKKRQTIDAPSIRSQIYILRPDGLSSMSSIYQEPSLNHLEPQDTPYTLVICAPEASREYALAERN